MDPRQAITEVTSLGAVVHSSAARPRFFTILLSGFAALGVAGVALLACWIPSYRATRVAPMEALRYE